MSKVFCYNSVFAPYMNELVKIKDMKGVNTLRFKWILNEFDQFAVTQHLDEPIIKKEFIEYWRRTRINDSISTLNYKYSVWKQLAIFMSRQGCDCYVVRTPSSTDHSNTYTPYIYTKEQMSNIFEQSERLRLSQGCRNSVLILIPTIIRLLYSTGLRISEALSIRNKDVEFEKRYIFIRNSKNGTERIVPINETLMTVLQRYKYYRDKIPVKGILDSGALFFIKANGAECNGKTVTHWFRIILEKCHIPYIGNHQGPRIHDLRHTFAVHSFEQMSRNGIDFYTSQPIISAMLGHKRLQGTERYIRLTTEMYPELVNQYSDNSAAIYPH